MGDVITFVGTYSASKGQAAAVTFYTFVGACVHGAAQGCASNPRGGAATCCRTEHERQPLCSV